LRRIRDVADPAKLLFARRSTSSAAHGSIPTPVKHFNFVIGKSPLSRGLGSGLHMGDRIGLAVMKVGRDVVAGRCASRRAMV
jgi:hypothetical protein